MSGIVRNMIRASKFTSLATTSTNKIANIQAARSLWHMSRQTIDRNSLNSPRQILTPHTLHDCTCGCSRHTKAERDLVAFLADEILAEKKAQKLKTIPTEVDGFAVSLDGANVTLTKHLDDEKIVISFNVNHTVDTDTESEIDPSDDKPEFGEMKSKPNFTVDVQQGNQTLGFSCSFTSDAGASGGNESYNDCFGIDEITIYEGEHNDKVYAVAGEVIDGYLYDLLMNYLEEKGISYDFAEKIIDLSTSYEHSAYISLLEGLSKFTAKK